MKKLFFEIFSCFLYCRKKLGGTWYQVYEEYDDQLGTRSASVYWTKEKPLEYNFLGTEVRILKTESHN